MRLSSHSLDTPVAGATRDVRVAALAAAFGRYVSSTVALGVGLIAHTLGLILVARALGPAQFGTLALVTTVSSLGLAVSGLGGSEILRRTVARDRAIYPRALGHALLTLVPLSLALSILLSLGLAWWLPLGGGFGADFGVHLLLVVSNITLFAWLGLAEQVLLAFDANGLANLVNTISGIARALAALLACLVFHVDHLSTWAFWHFGFYAAASAVALAAIWHYGRPTLALLAGEIGKGATLSLTSLLMILRQNADMLALSLVATPETIGVYSVARRVVGTASVLSASFDRVVYSNLARAGTRGVAAVVRLAKRYALLSGALCLGATVATYAGAPLLPYIFGASYEGAVPMLRALSGLLLLTGLHYLAFDALNASDQHKPRLTAELAASVAGLGLLAIAALEGTLTSIILATYAATALVVVALWVTLFRLDAMERLRRDGSRT
jgi:O-antigen/teichoic acid export membrane protein